MGKIILLLSLLLAPAIHAQTYSIDWYKFAGGGGNSAPVTTSSNHGTTPGSYSVTVYAFTESNTSDGSNAHADASVAIPLTVN